MNSYYIKFKGKFTDLIPNGWQFCKLFARNYRQYHKTCDGEQYSQGCRIWQHLGGYMEIEDLFSLSYLIVKQIQDGKIDEWASLTKCIFSKKDEVVYYLLLDMDERRFLPYHSKERIELKRPFYTTDMKPEDIKAFSKRYREFNMRPELITMIKDMLKRDWLEVVEDVNGKVYRPRTIVA